MIGGTAVVTPGPEEETEVPSSTSNVDDLFIDAALYELGGGLTLAIPTDIVEDTMVLFDEDLGDGSEPVFPRVYHRSSYEAAIEDFDAPMGFLFSFFRETGFRVEILRSFLILSFKPTLFLHLHGAGFGMILGV